VYGSTLAWKAMRFASPSAMTASAERIPLGARGSGLIGLRDRVEALGGSIAVESPRGGGTRIHVAIPVPADQPIGSPRPAAGS
jgi:signal transduction histidine kinase